MYHYAQIDSDGVAVGESWLSGAVEANDLILLEDGVSPMGMRYDRETAVWEAYTPSEPDVDNSLSDLDQAIYDTQANTEYLVCLAELNM